MNVMSMFCRHTSQNATLKRHCQYTEGFSPLHIFWRRQFPRRGYCCLVKDGVRLRLQQHGKLVREKKRTLKQVKKSIADLMQKNAEMLKELEALNVAVNERRHIHNISGLSLSLSLISATSSVCRSV